MRVERPSIVVYATRLYVKLTHMWLWIIRFIIVLLFLLIFVIRGSRIWGIGLLTVSLMVLLDAARVRGVLDEIGYFDYVLGGMLAGGAFLWLVGLLWPTGMTDALPSVPTAQPLRGRATKNKAFDSQMIFEQIRTNLSPDDVRDLIFDLDLKENDVLNPALDMPSVIVGLLNMAEETGQTGTLALAVERILTPLPAESLPRAEKLSAESPPSLLRQYLVATHSLAELEAVAAKLGIDWENLNGGKKQRARQILLHLKRRNQLDELLAYLHKTGEETVPVASA